MLIEQSLDLKLRHSDGFDALAAIVEAAECYVVETGDVQPGIERVKELVS